MTSRDAHPQDPQALLAHMEWARRLARRLVTDAHDAEDVAQEAWLAAARHPPRLDSEPRAWLGRVLHNQALQLRRRESARSAREWRVAAATESPSDAELQSGVDAQRRLAACVMALDEPYRRAVILRYWRELSPAAIAAQEGVPLATVKTRLRRALAELREQLAREYATEGRNWFPALAVLGAPRIEWITIGGLLVAKQTSIAASILLVLSILGAILMLRPEPAPVSVGSLTPRSDAMAPADVVVASDEGDASSAGAGELALGREVELPADGGPTLTVVDGRSGAPLEGAAVWILAYSKVVERSRPTTSKDRDDPEPVMLELGRRMESRSAGLVELPAFEETQLAIARQGDLFGVRILEGGEGPVIRLWKDRTLTIKVVDPSGQPVPGVPVALQSGTGRSPDVYWTKLTDERGIALMRHVGIEWYDLLDPGAHYYAALSFPLAEPVEVMVDPEAFPVEPVELTLPATGSASVELVDAGGAPAPMRTWVHLQPLAKSPTVPERAESGRRFGEWLDHESRAVFPHVGLGLELQTSTPASGITKAASVLARGPTGPGEHVVVKLGVGATYAFFSGRLIDTGGNPLALGYLGSSRVTYRDQRGEEQVTDGRAELDGKGGFQMPVDDSTPGGLPCTLSFQTPAQAGPVLRGELEALTPAPGEVVECGDIVLRSAPLAVRGRVLDERGAPVSWVGLSAGRKLFTQPPDDEFRWEFGVDLEGVYTDQNGVFEIWGEVDPGEYALWPSKTSYTSMGWTPFAIGAQDVEIVLPRECVVAGTVLADGGFALERLSVVIEDPTHDPVREWFVDTRSQVQSSGAFRIEGLRPGRVRLLVQSGRYSGALWVVNDVELVAGECADARVRTIDVRGRLHAHEIEFVDDLGNPVAAGCATIRPGDSGEESRTYVLEEGRAAWIGDTRAVDVHVRAPGYRDASVLGVSGSRRVALEKGIPVTLRLPPDVELPPSPWVLEVVLHPSGNRPQQSRKEYTRDSARELYWSARRVDSHAQFGSDLQATLHVPFEGRFEVGFELSDPGDSSRSGQSEEVRPATGTVDIGLSGANVEVRHDSADYARVLATVR